MSVVMPVFNAESTVGAAAESILQQTYPNLELVVVDDGSTDRSVNVVRALRDRRVRLLEQANQGPGSARRVGVMASRGSYIAVQDADDFSYPHRLSSQVSYLERSQACVAVGAWAEVTRRGESTGRLLQHSTETGMLYFLSQFDSQFVASTVTMRREAVVAVGNYRPVRYGLEDLELWLRLRNNGAFANLPEILLTYDERPGSLSRLNIDKREAYACWLVADSICCTLGHKHQPPCIGSLECARGVRGNGSQGRGKLRSRLVLQELALKAISKFPSESLSLARRSMRLQLDL